MLIKVFLRQFKQIFHDICAERKARKIASDSKYEEDRRLAFFLRNVHSSMLEA